MKQIKRKTMRAAVLEAPQKLVLKDVPIPLLHSRSILIKIIFCAVCGSDIKIFLYGHPKIHLPQIIGHEFVGEIVAKGKEVKGFRIGERVTVATSIGCGECGLCCSGFTNLCDNLTPISYDFPGAFAEYLEIPPVAVDNGYVVKVPAEIPSEIAALTEPLSCVVNSQRNAALQKNDSVAIIGAGPLGLLQAHLARSKGVKKLYLIQRPGWRFEYLKKYKKFEVIDSTSEDLIEKIKKITNGQGIDVVIVTAPTKEAQEQALSIVAKRGRVNLFASLPKNAPTVSLDINLIHYRELFISGCFGSTATHYSLALEMLRKNKIDIIDIITHRFPLDKINDAFKTLIDKKGIKVLIKP